MPTQPNHARDRNVYILGAGFSANAGAPLVNVFLDRARRLMSRNSNQLNDAERKHFEAVFDYRQEMSRARDKVILDLDNIENLFGLVEISNRLQETLNETRNSTIYMIAKTLQLEIGANPRDFPKFSIPANPREIPNIEALGLNLEPGNGDQNVKWYRIGMYDYFAGLVCGLFNPKSFSESRKDTVITFNYDLVFERGLRNIGFDADYNLNKEIVSDRRPTPTGGYCDVLKLHGSTNWGVCAACNNRVVVLDEKVTVSPDDFRQMQCKCGKSDFHPFLIPPSWDKSEYRSVIAPVWKKAIEELKAANRICIIGYSMPEMDGFFKYLLTMALAHNSQLEKLIVVDFNQHDGNVPPEEAPVRQRYLNLFDAVFRDRRFEFTYEGLHSFLANPGWRQKLERGDALVNTLFQS
jgi:NAD-dependent SIR2 family protein deacetylase